MAPLVVSVHSIVGLDFAGAATVGWHSTQFPPFFVFGALLSGFAMVMLLVIPLRRLLRLEDFITGRHIDVLCRLMLASSLRITYSYIMDVFTTYYGGDSADRTMFIERVSGYYIWRLLGHDSVQLPHTAIDVVPRACGMNQPLVAAGLPRHHRRHVARALRDRGDQPAPAPSAIVVGRLPRHVLGLAHAGRHGRAVPYRHSAGWSAMCRSSRCTRCAASSTKQREGARPAMSRRSSPPSTPSVALREALRTTTRGAGRRIRDLYAGRVLDENRPGSPLPLVMFVAGVAGRRRGVRADDLCGCLELSAGHWRASGIRLAFLRADRLRARRAVRDWRQASSAFSSSAGCRACTTRRRMRQLPEAIARRLVRGDQRRTTRNACDARARLLDGLRPAVVEDIP